MKQKTMREIPVLFIRGSEELGRATGITAPKTHARWRAEGLRYFVMDDGTFLYDPSDVADFIKRRYEPQQVNLNLSRTGL